MIEKIYLIAIFGLLIFSSCSYINHRLGLEDDNSGEELLEEVIETTVQVKTGYRPTLDLTPSSKE